VSKNGFDFCSNNAVDFVGPVSGSNLHRWISSSEIFWFMSNFSMKNEEE
jgi:hypothetical protein